MRSLPAESNTQKRIVKASEENRQRALLAQYRDQQARRQRRLRVVA